MYVNRNAVGLINSLFSMWMTEAIREVGIAIVDTKKRYRSGQMGMRINRIKLIC